MALVRGLMLHCVFDGIPFRVGSVHSDVHALPFLQFTFERWCRPRCRFRWHVTNPLATRSSCFSINLSSRRSEHKSLVEETRNSPGHDAPAAGGHGMDLPFFWVDVAHNLGLYQDLNLRWG